MLDVDYTYIGTIIAYTRILLFIFGLLIVVADLMVERMSSRAGIALGFICIIGSFGMLQFTTISEMDKISDRLVDSEYSESLGVYEGSRTEAEQELAIARLGLVKEDAIFYAYDLEDGQESYNEIRKVSTGIATYTVFVKHNTSKLNAGEGN